MLLLIAGTLFSLLALIFLAAYLFTGGKRTILMRLAGASAIIASMIWVYRSTGKF